MKKILLFGVIMLILTGCSNKEIKEEKQITENNGMLSYTIDGEKTDIKPTKEDGYIVNKIICDNGTDLMWDNDNWEVELTKINSKDSCKIDFTKDTTKEGYRVTVTSNVTSALDSLSKVTTNGGTIKIYSKSTIKNVIGCNGVIEDNKVVVSNVTSNQTCNIEVEDKTLAGTIKIAYPPKPGRTDFSVIDNGIPALYTDIDDQGTTYYFSGDGTNMNNWVSFAGKMWRIIRINGNGSVRLLYAGDGNDATDIGSTAFNTIRNHPQYVGWKYTEGKSLSTNRQNGTPSTIYKVIETWNNSLESTNQNYIDTEAIYCNDREENGSYSTSSRFFYAAYERLVNNKAPIFTCSSTSDRFITFGLMTADEVAFAGGLYGNTNSSAYYYLAKDGISSITGSSSWWTMTPYYFSAYAHVFNVGGSGNFPGYFSYEKVRDSYVVRPVVSLKPEVQVIAGDGSASTPYEVILP